MKTQNMTNIPLPGQVRVLQDRIISLEKELADQKRTRDSLVVSEKNLSAILEHNPDGIVIVDTEGIVLYVNPAAELLFCRNKKEFLGSDFGFPVSTDHEDRSIVILSGKVFCEVDFRVVKVQWLGQPAFQLSVRDTSRLRQAEDELTISEGKFKLITENSADAIFITDDTGKYIYTNKAVTNLLGFSSKELKRKTLLDLSPKYKKDERNYR